jgi:hypothetical protein
LSAKTVFWYIFPSLGILIVLSRVRLLRSLRDPLVRAFILSIGFVALGSSCKAPALSAWINGHTFTNMSWLLADGFFLVGGYIGMLWLDQMGHEVFFVAARWRKTGLLVALAVMVTAVAVELPAFQQLELGGIDVGHRPALLIGRMAYFGYSLFFLGYLAYGLNHHRQRAQDHHFRVRLAIPALGIAVSMIAPVIQVVGTLIYWVAPQPGLWPALWPLVTGIQVVVAACMVIACLPGRGMDAVIGAILWLEKQLLYRQLLGLHHLIADECPEVILEPVGRWDRLNPRQIGQRLSRTVVEIADGRRKLSVYAPAELWDALDKADGKSYNDRVGLEARLIRESSKRKREGASPRSKPAPILVEGTPWEVARFYARVARRI